jgi:hypothetical protein
MCIGMLVFVSIGITPIDINQLNYTKSKPKKTATNCGFLLFLVLTC